VVVATMGALVLGGAVVSWGGSAFAAGLDLLWVDNSTDEGGFEVERRALSRHKPPHDDDERENHGRDRLDDDDDDDEREGRGRDRPDDDDERGRPFPKRPGFVNIQTLPRDATSFRDTGLEPGVVYCYRVRAFNTAGFSKYSNVACKRTPKSRRVRVDKTGSGDGAVMISPGAQHCGADCSALVAAYDSGLHIVLTATAAPGSVFHGWSGGGCGRESQCAVSLRRNTVFTATFRRLPGPSPRDLPRASRDR
jgi:hypothetical protein